MYVSLLVSKYLLAYSPTHLPCFTDTDSLFCNFCIRAQCQCHHANAWSVARHRVPVPKCQRIECGIADNMQCHSPYSEFGTATPTGKPAAWITYLPTHLLTS
jgi:hypothetical protein